MSDEVKTQIGGVLDLARITDDLGMQLTEFQMVELKQALERGELPTWIEKPHAADPLDRARMTEAAKLAPGESLFRDIFAGFALVGLLSSRPQQYQRPVDWPEGEPWSPPPMPDYSGQAYTIAESMLAARRLRGEKRANKSDAARDLPPATHWLIQSMDAQKKLNGGEE